jgi:glycosyltransferase involved in cell wall biosynthesis
VSVPAVSVILPTYNRAALLPASAGSVLAQGCRDLELLIVDDGSTEDIAAVARGFGDARVRCIRRERGGPAAARNSGVRAARGRWLAFQDSDDTWHAGKLERQLRALPAGAGDEAMVVCGLLRTGGRAVRTYPPPALRRREQLSRRDVLRYPFAYTQSWLVPRAAVLAAGGFDESLRVWDDWDLLIRLAARLRLHLVVEPLVTSPIGPGSIAREHERFLHDLPRIIDKHAPQLAADERALLCYAHGRLLLAGGRAREARAALAETLRLQPAFWRAAVFFAWSLLQREAATSR